MGARARSFFKYLEHRNACVGLVAGNNLELVGNGKPVLQATAIYSSFSVQYRHYSAPAGGGGTDSQVVASNNIMEGYLERMRVRVDAISRVQTIVTPLRTGRIRVYAGCLILRFLSTFKYRNGRPDYKCF